MNRTTLGRIALAMVFALSLATTGCQTVPLLGEAFAMRLAGGMVRLHVTVDGGTFKIVRASVFYREVAGRDEDVVEHGSVVQATRADARLVPLLLPSGRETLWAQADLPPGVPSRYVVYQWVIAYKLADGTDVLEMQGHAYVTGGDLLANAPVNQSIGSGPAAGQ